MDPEPSTGDVGWEASSDGLADSSSTAVAPGGSDPSAEGAPVTPVPAPVVRSGTAGPIRAAGYLLAAAGGIALTLAVLVGSGSISIGPTPTPSPEPTFAMSGASVGVASAPVTIEVWADFQCPFCGVFTHGIEPTLLREYAANGSAVVRFRDFAFLGQESIDAAVAARCADRRGRFWRYHDLLFASQQGENQGAFGRQNLVQLAAFAGLDQQAFGTCLDDPDVAGAVTAETTEGRSLGVESTPTLRIVGPGGARFVKGISTPDAIAEAIAKAASPAPSGSPAGGGPSPTASPARSGPAQTPSASASPGG